jgi:acetyltransferase
VAAAMTAIRADVRRAGLTFRGFVVEQQVAGLADLIVGGHVDPEFGPVVVFGSGGSGAEGLSDSAVDLLPLEPHGGRFLLESTRIGRAILAGQIVDADVVDNALRGFAAWFAGRWRSYPSVDVNPVRVVSRRELVALDARVIEPAGRSES